MTAVLDRPAAPAARHRWPAKVLGAARYEYLMQVRRPAVWLVVLALIGLRMYHPWPLLSYSGTALHPLVGDLAFNFMMLGPIGVGVVLADRGLRESRLGLGDLLGSAPTGPGPRWWGKAIGATAATLTPVACAWAVLLVYLATVRGAGVIPLGIASFAAVILPGMLFVAAASLAIPQLIGAPLYRLGLIGYWFWGNMAGAPRYGIPTLAGTPFEAIGEYQNGYWFGGQMFDAADRGIPANGGDAVLSIAVLLAVSLAILALTHLVLAKRAERSVS
jgi:hypothetical protein